MILNDLIKYEKLMNKNMIYEFTNEKNDSYNFTILYDVKKKFYKILGFFLCFTESLFFFVSISFLKKDCSTSLA